MSVKCGKCGFELKEKKDNCPNCGEKIIYSCKCGKQLPNLSYKICPECKRKRFVRGKIIVGIVIAIITPILMFIPDPIPIADEAIFGALGTAGFVFNIFRKMKEE